MNQSILLQCRQHSTERFPYCKHAQILTTILITCIDACYSVCIPHNKYSSQYNSALKRCRREVKCKQTAKTLWFLNKTATVSPLTELILGPDHSFETLEFSVQFYLWVSVNHFVKHDTVLRDSLCLQLIDSV